MLHFSPPPLFWTRVVAVTFVAQSPDIHATPLPDSLRQQHHHRHHHYHHHRHRRRLQYFSRSSQRDCSLLLPIPFTSRSSCCCCFEGALLLLAFKGHSSALPPSPFPLLRRPFPCKWQTDDAFPSRAARACCEIQFLVSDRRESTWTRVASASHQKWIYAHEM